MSHREEAERIILDAAKLSYDDLFSVLRVHTTAAILHHEAMKAHTVGRIATTDARHCKACFQAQVEMISTLAAIERDMERIKVAGDLLDQVSGYKTPPIALVETAYKLLRDRADRQALEETLEKS